MRCPVIDYECEMFACAGGQCERQAKGSPLPSSPKQEETVKEPCAATPEQGVETVTIRDQEGN